MHASIWLKLGILIGGLKVNTSIKFGANLINIQGVIINLHFKLQTSVMSTG